MEILKRGTTTDDLGRPSIWTADKRVWRRGLRLRRGILWAGLALAVPLTLSVPACAQSVSEYEVKAAFLYSFAKFVTWPPQRFKGLDDPILICILGPNPFGNTLEQTIRGKVVDGRSFKVQQLSENEPAGSCKILFVHPAERKRFRSLLATTKGAGVLTVGEDASFTADGGIIEFTLEGGKVHFEINLAAAQYEDVQISSKLLGLAHVVVKFP